MMKTYSSYKDTSLSWLPQVPSHWELKRLRFLAKLNPPKSEMSQASKDTEVSFFPMESIGEDGSLSSDQVRQLGQVENGYTYFQEGDVTIAKITPCFENGKGAIMTGLVNGIGFGTTELIVARTDDALLLSKFLFALFSSKPFRLLGEASMYGAGGQKRVPNDFVENFVVPLPPIEEQTKIANFLDRETAQIDALVEEQRRLIELLKEKRQAVISYAVTKGLNPDAPMKDSGIEWLGEVPEHWEVASVGYRYDIQLGRMLNAERAQGRDMRPYLRVFDVQWGTINTEDLPQMDFPPDARTRYRLKEGDLLVNEGGSYVGRSAVWRGQLEECYYQKALHRMRPKSDAADTTDFFYYVMEFATVRGVFVAGGNQTTIDHLTTDQLRAYRFAFPPLAEQVKISAHLNRETEAIESLVGQTLHALKLLQERRSALISAAVTGKIDVRRSAEVVPFSTSRRRVRGLVATEIIIRNCRSKNFGRTKLQKEVFLAEAFAGISELGGSYVRMTYGPLDEKMIEEMEAEAEAIAGITTEQPSGRDTIVTYTTKSVCEEARTELFEVLGAERIAKLDKLIDNFRGLSTKGAEAVATLYAVWNDALIEGKQPSDDEIVFSFLKDWHLTKAERFSRNELHTWLDWMRRHQLMPSGTGPRTSSDRLPL